ncbi:orotate phosphoribosyltransferase [Candidatus Purcelliella pentastirinorum]|uniref:orotate phosphoribosyltransferase n=1 Tax=Candidatus Purcelliella pentastirinorum TaxID=472834 RepID=UPI00236779E1|nr:orotate phosphoribosyltransferase [Candidatus Purcelliella pentastirinorum]WDI78860.1 orotate phosphoribosyltransferase [Candidatus Purcelliella pentastirinorum]WDR79993.1 orotate phosphoribosyltransferase [Candidatus Purcelliella pentastirinorum]
MNKSSKKKIIKSLINKKVFKFKKFILKSGRISPYFFNSGILNTGNDLIQIGNLYAKEIKKTNITFDVLFGTAYKGIPIVIATAIALSKNYNINKPYCFNRKEIKKYGEQGKIIGCKLKGKVIIIDDVITIGTAIKESINILSQYKTILTGIFVFFDRQENKCNNMSAVQIIEKKYSCKINKIITLNNLIKYIRTKPKMKNELNKIYSYQKQYGLKNKIFKLNKYQKKPE